MMIASFIPDFV